MICDEISNLMQVGKIEDSKTILKAFINRVLAEYKRGFADNDHALMQNTGVCDGLPIHIDVGQFVYNDQIKKPEFHLQELYTKTYKFRMWLNDNYPQSLKF